jgi:hypothetical protein
MLRLVSLGDFLAHPVFLLPLLLRRDIPRPTFGPPELGRLSFFGPVDLNQGRAAGLRIP